MDHQWVTHENCQINYCPFCDGGLSACKVCGLIEGSLTTDCPGVNCYNGKADDVYKGKIDFINGEWINRKSPHSPGR